MNSNQVKLLSKMKKLINLGHRRFEIRSDRDYLEELLEIGITEKEAWKYILGLNFHFYFVDPKPSFVSNSNTLIFKREINGIMTYIKLKIEDNNGEDETVCLSFHKDER